MPEPGLCWTNQRPVAPTTHVDIGSASASDIWEEIATSDSFVRALKSSVREILTARTKPRAEEMELYDFGVTALDGGYARYIAGLDRAPETDAYQDAVDLTAQLGQDGMTFLGHGPMEAVETGPVACLQAGSVCPTLSIDCPEEFRQRPRAQRSNILSLLAVLATACDIRVHGSALTARWVLQKHGDSLPSSFRKSLDAGREKGSPVDKLVTAAREQINPDGREVTVLRQLAEEPGETLPYGALKARHSVSTSRISQVLGTLEDLSLIDRHGTGSEKLVSLRKAGSALLDTLDAEIGQQATLDETFSASGQRSTQAVYARPDEGSPPAEGEPHQPSEASSVPYRTRFLNRTDHVPAAAVAPQGGIAAVDSTSLDTDTDYRHTRFVSYDEGRDEAVLAVFAAGPLQYAVSTAIALASPRFFDRALPVSRLEEIDLSPELLRGARCIGGLDSDAESDRSVLRDALVEWGEKLEGMTTDLKRGEYENRDRFRSEIMRSAHGLAGTIVHLLDIAGVDVVREVRLPRSLPDERLASLSQTISVSAAIQSRYGHYAVFRQLFEQRDKKRKTALEPDIDAEDRLGELIGGFVLRGPNATRLGQHLEGTLSSPKPVHSDAPDISLEISVTTPDRNAYAQTVARMCAQKNLNPRRTAVTLFRALVGSPYPVAESFDGLDPEDHSRAIRVSEVRVALSTLDSSALLPDAPKTISKVLSVLLRAEAPLSRSGLANTAEVSSRSLRRHLPSLIATDLVRETETGYSLALSFDTSDDRGTNAVPKPVEADSSTTPVDLLFEAAIAYVEDTKRLGDPSDPLGAGFVWPQDTEQIVRHIPHFAIPISALCDLCEVPDLEPPVVSIDAGVSSRQQGLQSSVQAVAD